jgi:PAS domain S-box-containing protein
MIVPKEIFEAAFDSLPEGVGLISEDRKALFWNRAAEAVTGFPAMELIGRELPEPLALLFGEEVPVESFSSEGLSSVRGAMVKTHHKQGHTLQLMARLFVLRDPMGARIGWAAVFHAEELLGALPHGEYEDDLEGEMQQADFEDRLATVYEDFLGGGKSFGLLWIMIDQAAELRRTHGANACRGMIEKVEHALSLGLRAREQMARWGDDEFLVLSHERSAEMLETHAQTLAGLARTVDFRWWGDRLSITVSVGFALSCSDVSLAEMLNQTRSAMEASVYAGGNKITRATGGNACLPS